MLKKGNPAHVYARLKRLLSLLLTVSLLSGLSPRVSALWEADLVKTAIRAGVQTGSYLYEDAYFQAADAPMETQPLLKPERTVRAAMRLSFALNDEGKLVAEGTLAMSDWSSWRGVFPVRFVED